MHPLDPSLLTALLDPKNETDDSLRMAIADWIEEHDQPERAEFIRLQLKTQWSIGVLNSWRERERELLDWHGLEWLNPSLMALESERAGCACQWRRGFVHAITLSAAAWIANADAILAAQPVREVTLTTWPHSLRTPHRESTLEMLAAEWPHIRFTLPSSPAATRWEINWPGAAEGEFPQMLEVLREQIIRSLGIPAELVHASATPAPLMLSPLEEEAGATGGYTVPPEFVEPLRQAIPSSREARRRRKQRQARTHAKK